MHDTITIAAPVEINGETVCVAVAVKRTSKNKYHAHRVLTIKGEKFVIKETKNDTKPTTPGMTTKNDGEGPGIGSVSENNITLLPVEVKKKYSYAGIGAKTHDMKTLEQAVRLDDIGKATPEEIRKQTGWFKGCDGKWRFGLDERIKKITDVSVTMASECPQRSAETSVTDNIS